MVAGISFLLIDYVTLLKDSSIMDFARSRIANFSCLVEHAGFWPYLLPLDRTCRNCHSTALHSCRACWSQYCHVFKTHAQLDQTASCNPVAGFWQGMLHRHLLSEAKIPRLCSVGRVAHHNPREIHTVATCG